MRALVEMEHSGLIPMLRDDKYEGLARMYHLFRRVEGGAQLIRTVMSDHVKEVGKQLVQDPEKTKVGVCVGGGQAWKRVLYVGRLKVLRIYSGQAAGAGPGKDQGGWGFI